MCVYFDSVNMTVRLVSFNHNSTYLLASDNQRSYEKKCKSNCCKGQDKSGFRCAVLALLRRTGLCGEKDKLKNNVFAFFQRLLYNA